MRALLALVLVALIGVGLFVLFNQTASTQRDDPTAPGQAATQTTANDGASGAAPANLVAEGEGTQRSAIPEAAPEQPKGMQPAVSSDQPLNWGNGIHGRVLSSTGEPVGNARLTLTLYGPDQLFAPSEEDRASDVNLTSEKDGTYRFKNLHPDKEYTIIAYRADVGRKVESGLRVGKGKNETLDIVLEPGVRLFGVVKDPSGQGISGVELTLKPSVLAGDNPAGTLYAQTDAGGEYTFDNVGRGLYELAARADGFGTETVGGLTISGDDAVQQDITMDAAYLIEGRVTAEDGMPLAGAVVEAHGRRRQDGTSAHSQVKTDEDGHFSFNDIGKGSYSIMAQAPGYRTGMERNVATGNLAVEIQLEAQPSISGHVLDPSGAPLKNFTVQLRRRMQNSTETIPVPRQRFKVTDSEDGAYLLSCPNKGDYSVQATSPRFAPTSSEMITIGDKELRENVDITMTAGGLIRGRVMDADGPVAGARVKTYHTDFVVGDPFFAAMTFPGNATEKEVVSSEDGSFELPTLTPCTYQIHIVSEGHAPFTQRGIEVKEGGEIDLGNVVIATGSKLSGRVTDADGKGVSGATVFLMLDAQALGEKYGANYTARTHSDGTYAFSALPPGPYNVWVQRGAGGDILSGPEDVQATRRSITLSDATESIENFQFE